MAFTANCCAIATASKARNDFSGRLPLISRAPLATMIRSKLPSNIPMTRDIESSSARSKPSTERDRPTTSPRNANACTSAAPIPPEAPITNARIRILPPFRG